MKYIDEVLELQKEYFKSGETLDLDFRIDMLKKLKDILLINEDKILEALYMDLNKSSFEGYSTELGIVLDEIGFIIKNIKKWSRPKRLRTNIINFKSKSYVMREAYGNALIVSPWNYPVLLTLSPLLGSIAAGNTSVIKPSEHSPYTSKLLEDIINNNFDKKYIHLINGDLEVSKYVLSKRFDYIFYTGSTEVGKIVMKNASEFLTPVTLELGGKSPCIIDKNSDIKLSAKRIVWGKFLNSGQTCVAPDYLLVDKQVKDKLIENIIYYVDNMILKNKDEYPKVINRKHFLRLLNYTKNVDILYNGGYDEEKLKIYPIIVDNPDWDSPIMKEEIFGPILPIKSYSHVDELIDELKEKEKPLALYVFSNDKTFIDKILKNLSFGGGCINDTIMHLSNPHLPFGGVGNSGMGNYHGKYSYESFTHEKSILDKSTRIDLPTRYQPYEGKFKLIKKILK